MRNYYFFTIVTVIILLTANCGCIQQKPVATENTNSIVMEPATPTLEIIDTATTTSSEYMIEDKKFIDAAEECYRNTPSITNITTHNTFLKCMQNTSNPTSICAKSYKHDVLKYTNVDDTTAGYQRETHNVYLFRSMFFKNMAYNATRQEFEPCL